MNSSRNDWRNRYGDVNRQRKSSYPEAGYNSGWGSSEGQPYRYSERFAHDRGEPRRNIEGSQRDQYRGVGHEHPDYEPGYSTANDFAEQESPFARSQRSGHTRDYRGYGRADFPQYHERYKRGEYPETYRSAASGYMSEHVGSDYGRRDYNQNINEGNLYGRRYGLYHYEAPPDYWRSDERGYMSEDDYDRGSPLYGEKPGYRNLYSREKSEAWLHRGKGPRNYIRADDRVREDINDRLTDDPFVDASDVEVAVQKCEVILTGTVDSRQSKRRAEDIAESVSGVTHIENRIRVRSEMEAGEPSVVTPY